MGLNKADNLEGGLMRLLRTYIIYMVIVTMHAVISLRQLQMRVKIGENVANLPKLLFQNITRADAEKDLVGLIKYLLNFGFYKFGIEISLIALVSTITYRQDFVAVVYAVWLVVLLLLKRSQCAKLWGIFQTFFAISILLQYIVLIGLPPSWCTGKLTESFIIIIFILMISFLCLQFIPGIRTSLATAYNAGPCCQAHCTLIMCPS